MPTWVQFILGAAMVVTAMGVLWQKVVKPAFRLAQAADELVPLLADFTEAFKGTPQVFLILNEIAKEFRTDSGTTLRDIVNRLEALLDALTLAAEADRHLSADDRRMIARVVLLLDSLGVKADEGAVDRAVATADRAVVAEDLARAKTVLEGVASDLDASHARADAAEPGDAGAAADAASRTDPEAGGTP